MSLASPGRGKNLCAQLSLDWLFFPVSQAINPACCHLTREHHLPSCPLSKAAEYFPESGTLGMALLSPFPFPKASWGCSDQQNEPRDSPLAGHWSGSPADRLRERRWHELRWDKMSEKLCRSSFGKLSVNPHQARKKKKKHTGLPGG